MKAQFPLILFRAYRLLGLCALSAATLMLPAEAGAQSAKEKAGARAAANSGADAFEAGDFEKAVDMFQRAESIIHSPVHELYLARSYTKMGRLVEARETYLKIIRENEGERAETAQQELDELEGRVPRVTLNVVGTDTPASEITVNDKPFPLALVGVAQPFDPGEHTVIVVAGDRRLSESFSIEEGDNQTVELDVSQGELVETAAEPEPLSEDNQPVESKPEKKGINAMRIGSYASLGLGVAGIGLGTFFSVRAGSKANEANDLCATIDSREGTMNCSGRTSAEEERVDELEQAHRSSKTIGIVGYAAGGALLVTGVTLFLLSRQPKTEQARADKKFRVHPALGVSYLGLEGTF